MSDAYRSAGYESAEIGFGERPAILVVDFQRGFTDSGYALGGFPMVHKAVENTAVVLELARQKGIPVACCYTAYGSEKEMPYWKVDVVRKEFFHGHPCTELDPRIHEPGYDFVFSKGAASIFFQTPLVTFLAKQRVDTTIVTGCTTSGCIRASVIDSFSHGYRTMLPAECSGDAEEGPHEANLSDMRRRYADVCSMDEVCTYLERLER